MAEFAPGMRVIIRDEEWMIRKCYQMVEKGTETDTKRGLEIENHTETTNKTDLETTNHSETTNKTGLEIENHTETINKIGASKSAQEITQESDQEGIHEVAQEIVREITQESAQEITQESAQENKNDISIENNIIRLIIEKPEITRNELAQKLHISPDNVKYRLGKLKKLGMIEHQGSTKAGKWAIIAQSVESRMR